jgi:Putative MetA-pathway of phenol degradation
MSGLTAPRRANPLSFLTISLALAAAAAPSAALADGAPLADAHAPAGVMLDHMHKAGEFMVGYRYMYGRRDGDMLHGTGTASNAAVMQNACAQTCMMRPVEMTMQMHMLDIMYAPTDWLTLMLMPQWMTMDMTMTPLTGGMGTMSHDTDGIGDTIFGALVKLSEGPGYHLHTGVMFSAPSGSVDETNKGTLTHYGMQLGSGTWDFRPSLTYTGREGSWTWGAQMSGIIRMEDANEQGYRLGNVFQATAWGSYRLTNWLSASLRILHTQQGRIEGHYIGAHNDRSPPDLQSNYGGRFWDIGFGVNTVVPSGSFKGHRFSAEWLEPISDDVNGYQLERAGTLYVNWSKAF